MKRVKLFLNTNDEEINSWLTDMHNKAKEATDGNVTFIIHDVKLSVSVRHGMEEGIYYNDEYVTALVIYSHEV